MKTQTKICDCIKIIGKCECISSEPLSDFEQYDRDNPSIWLAFEKTTLEAIEKGFKNYSSKGVFEIIRWHTPGNIKKDGFKVNNDYTPDYSRKFMNIYKEHNGFFRTKKRN